MHSYCVALPPTIPQYACARNAPVKRSWCELCFVISLPPTLLPCPSLSLFFCFHRGRPCGPIFEVRKLFKNAFGIEVYLVLVSVWVKPLLTAVADACVTRACADVEVLNATNEVTTPVYKLEPRLPVFGVHFSENSGVVFRCSLFTQSR